MKHPVKNKINTIFVHVSDLETSVIWYSKLLGQTIEMNSVARPVHNMEIDHYTGLAIDAGPAGSKKEMNPSKNPLFNFHTDDIHEAYEFTRESGFQIVSDIVQFDDFAYFNISDPDGNVIMICTG